jgi:acetyltransferase EpsM
MPARQPNTKLLILGSYIFAEEVADIADETPGFAVSGFVENIDRGRCATLVLGKAVHWVDDLKELSADHHLICGIGTTKRRGYVEQVAHYGMPFATLVHPSARVSHTSRIGAGSILSVNTIVAAQSTVGSHVIMNRGASIGHHTVVGDFVTIGPGANIAGACTIHDGCYVAMGATIIDRVRIGANSIVGAGAVVTKDVPPDVQVMGVPARVVKEAVNGR